MTDKSKLAVKDALLELMAQKKFKQITVSELIKTAGISRGTFYTYFENLEDVRNQLIHDLYVQTDNYFAGYTASEVAKDPYPILLMLAKAMVQSRNPTKRLYKFINVYELGIELTDWMIKFILSDEVLVMSLGGEENAKIYSHFISGGIMYTYNNWMLNYEDDISPETIAKRVTGILMNGLTAVLQE